MKSLLPYGVIVVCGLAFYMYVMPLIDTIHTDSKTRSDYAYALTQAGQLAAMRDSLASTYAAIPQKDMANLQKIMPDTFDSVAFVTDANTIASQYGMTVREVKITLPLSDRNDVAQTVEKPYKTYIISLKVKGQYEQFFNFLKELERHIRLSDINKITIQNDQRADPKKQSTFMEYQVELQTYSLH